MLCNQYIQKLGNIHSFKNLTSEQHVHINNCSSCKDETDAYLSFLNMVDKEKKSIISPNVSTKVMNSLQQSHEPWIPVLKTAVLNAAVIILTLMMGFVSAYLLDNERAERVQIQLISQYFSSTSADFILENNWLNENLYEE